MHLATKRLAQASVLYGLSSIVGRALNYLLVPFYTSIFSPAAYGVITEWYAYAAFLQVIYAYGMETAYFRFATRETQYFHVALSTLTITSVGFSGLLVLLATPIVQVLGYPGGAHYVYYFAAILAVDTVLTIPFAHLRLQKKALQFVSLKLLQIALNVLLNLWWLYMLPYTYAHAWWSQLPAWLPSGYNVAHSIEYVFMANLLSNVAVLPFLLHTVRPLRWCLSWQQLQPMLRYALPLLLMGLAGTVNEMLSRAMLRHWLPVGFYPGQSNEAILGSFGACYKLSIFMSLGIQAFRYAAEPFFFTQAQDRNAPALFSTVMHWFIVLGCFVLLAIGINLELLGYLLLRREAYHMALPTVPYLLLGYLLLGIYYNLSVWFKLTDKTYYGIAITGVGAVVTGVCNYTLIPVLGYWGSVWATLASYTVMCSLCYCWGQKYYPIPYRLGLGIAHILGTMLWVVVANSIRYTSFETAVVSNLLLTLAFGAVLYGCNASKIWR